MKFGVREICDVVLKAKSAQKIGNKIFYKNEPVIYFDTLKTSSMEGASTAVYAQGGRGNARLVAWEGDRTVTFTMEDALISPEGFMILSGAGLIEAGEGKPVYQHVTETVDVAQVKKVDAGWEISVSRKPALDAEKYGNMAYVMFVKDGEIISEPYIPVHEEVAVNAEGLYVITVKDHEHYDNIGTDMKKDDELEDELHYTDGDPDEDELYNIDDAIKEKMFDSVIVDYYVTRESNAKQIEITADKFGGNYYLEASTLFRNQNGVDVPAEFIIPNCKVQSNFNFSMASTGDPSTFTFTMDAFPDYTRFDHSKKVLAAIQLFEDGASLDLHRHSTAHEAGHDSLFV